VDALTPALFVVGSVNLIAFPLLLWFIKRKLEKFDDKRDEARTERADAEKKATEQREAERVIILAMSRTMLLDNYEKCVSKGYYTLEEREVYHKLYEAYKDDGGNSIIDEIAPRIRKLPIEKPRD
jgi:hypothetical protein